MKLVAVMCACLLLVAAGCSSKKKSAASTTPPPATTTTHVAVLPPARTADVWARRVVNLLLRPLSQDLVVVSRFDSPQTRIYIQTGNALALKTVRTRMNNLSTCTNRLTTIGPPPAGKAPLAAVHRHLAAACASYVKVAQKLLSATDMLSSGRADVVKRGNAVAGSAGAPSRTAAQELTAAIRIAQRQPAFRRAGLNPSV